MAGARSARAGRAARWGLGLGLLALLGVSWVGAGNPLMPLMTGDEVRMHLRLYDRATGDLLFSNDPADVPALERVRAAHGGAFEMPTVFKAGGYRLGTGVVEFQQDPDGPRADLDALVMGRRVGDTVRGPVEGVGAGYSEIQAMERVRGPFPYVMRIPVPLVDRAFGAAAGPGDLVALDELLPARVLAREGDEALVRLELREGQRLQVRNTPLEVEVQPLDEQRFVLRLQAEEGQRFSLLQTCRFARYVLPIGSYVVEDVDEERVRFLHSPTAYPQLIGRQVDVEFTITERS